MLVIMVILNARTLKKRKEKKEKKEINLNKFITFNTIYAVLVSLARYFMVITWGALFTD
jgi:hypothetical protein